MTATLTRVTKSCAGAAFVACLCTCMPLDPPPKAPTPVVIAPEPGAILLEQVPADTPFLLLSTPDDSPAPYLKALAAVLSQVGAGPLVSLLDEKRPFVIFGLGASPAVRVEFDAEREAATALATFLEREGPAKRIVIEARGYYRRDVGGRVLLAAVNGLVLSATVVAPEHVAAAAPMIVSAAIPERSAAGIPADLEKRHRIDGPFAIVNVASYLSVGFGLRQSLGPISGQFVAETSTETECVGGVRTFARSFPRIVLGYRRRTASSAEGIMALEHHPSLKKTFAQLRTPMPRIHQTLAPFTLGLSVDFGRTFDLARGSLTALAPCKKRWPGIEDAFELINVIDEILAPIGGAGLAFERVPSRFGTEFSGAAVVLSGDPHGLRALASVALGITLPALSRFPLRLPPPRGGDKPIFLDLSASGGGVSIGGSAAHLSALLKSRSRRKSLLSVRAERTALAANDAKRFALMKKVKIDVELERDAVVCEIRVDYE